MRLLFYSFGVQVSHKQVLICLLCLTSSQGRYNSCGVHHLPQRELVSALLGSTGRGHHLLPQAASERPPAGTRQPTVVKWYNKTVQGDEWASFRSGREACDYLFTIFPSWTECLQEQDPEGALGKCLCRRLKEGRKKKTDGHSTDPE